MRNNKIEKGTWIALCDGARSLILSNFGDEKFFDFKLVDAAEGDRRKNSQMGHDRPARTHESNSARRSAIATIDKHDQHEHEFIESFVTKLRTAVDTKLTDKIVLVAPAKALGYLREILPASVSNSISFELEKDLLKMPLPEVEIAVKDAIGVK